MAGSRRAGTGRGLAKAGDGRQVERFRRALIVSSDIASCGLDWDTPASAAIFGDGAAAVCLEAGTDRNGPGLLARGFDVSQGLWVSTGAVTGVHEIAVGQEFRAIFVGHGELTCSIIAAGPR